MEMMNDIALALLLATVIVGPLFLLFLLFDR